MLDSTLIWRGFKITLVTRQGVTTAYEASCYIVGHHIQGATKRCTRTRAFLLYGGHEQVERMLKYWCLFGHCAECEDSDNHQAMVDPLAHELPSLDELDNTDVGEEKDLQSSKRRRNAWENTSIPCIGTTVACPG
jgi:hypothetical protein